MTDTDTPTEIRRCSSCKQRQPEEHFAGDRTRPDGKSPVCKGCRAEWARDHRRRVGPRQNYAYKIKRLYGLTLAEYDAMVIAQENRCAICRTDEPGGHGGRTWHVDHDHETGRVRGLLCSPCNTGLARFGDNPAVLRRAAEYLEALDGR